MEMKMGTSSQMKKARRIIRNWVPPEGMDKAVSDMFLDTVVSEQTTLSPKQIRRAKVVFGRKNHA